jgi:4-methyl-5(b-hydroxyethyl)-thiazole monophosphate biosynthesis
MIYMFIAQGFEEIEALCPLDLMRRAGLSVTTVGVGGDAITGAHGICVRTDITDAQFDGADLDMVFLPGGMPGTLNLAASDTVIGAIRDAVASERYIAAICAAPSILGDMGLLKGKQAVCYPGFEDRLTGAVIPDKKVVLDGKILTAKGMGAALDMGLEIVKIFCGERAARELRHAVIAD